MSVAAGDLQDSMLIRRAEPMREHTSWRVGGPADYFVEPTSVQELAAALTALPPELPLYWLGLGSNLLVRDGGVRGAVIATTSLPKELKRCDSVSVYAGAGLPCMRLARQCLRWQLGPAVFFAGIPGTVGGALAMNAGAFGGETWRNVESVVTIDRGGTVRTRERAEYEIGYRSVAGPPAEWFLGAAFRFEPDPSVPMTAIRALLAKRAATQPVGIPSCGSVFRNPPGDFAGRLIETAGMKGARIGGALVSPKHANFIVNTGAATAADIETLIERVRAAVEAQLGVQLALEVRVIGEPAVPGEHGSRAA